MNFSQLEPWLVMAGTPGIGIKTFHKLLGHYHHPSAFLATQDFPIKLPNRALDHLRAYREKRQEHAVFHYLESVRQWLRHDNVKVLVLSDDDYPNALKHIIDPPPVLYLQGNFDLLYSPQLAIVGSRQASQSGLDHAYMMARSLVQLGLTITSGMALGIDSAGHQGALDANGNTIAVLGTGINVVYPRSHLSLAERISEKGLLVSEWPLGAPPHKAHFPMRNRLISGLCLGVLVVEASLRSGSLITARLALEQGREVFAIPSSIQNPKARGCHHLIKQGAKLVDCVDDIIEELPIEPKKPTKALPSKANSRPSLTPSQQHLYGLIEYHPILLDELVERLCEPVAEILAGLMELELLGLIHQENNGYIRR